MNVSYELLILLQWLLEHEQETMKKVVSKALAHGLQERLDQHMTQRERQQAAAELQGGIIDFFLMLESSLHRTMNEDHTKEVIQRNLLPALKQMDARTYSIGALENSIAKAEAAFLSKHATSPKEILCKELLKRWKPHKKLAEH